MMCAHGFGCDQNMWRLVVPAFESEYRIVLFDHVGSGSSRVSAYSPEKYSSLAGYAQDILEICHEPQLENVIFVGHSVAAMMGVLAAIEEPDRFEKLVLVGPSPGTSMTLTMLAGSAGAISRHSSTLSTAIT